MLVTSSNFTKNIASVTGGALSLTTSARLVVTDSLIAGNAAQSGGGLAGFANTTTHLERVVVTNNTAEFAGGGMFQGDAAAVVVKHSLFHNNTGGAVGGGAVFLNESASCVITSSVISSNTATGDAIASGGGVHAEGSAQVRLVNSNVTGNRAAYGGGVFVTYDSQLVGQGVLVKDNIVTANGGGACAEGKSFLHFVASGILTNHAATGGGILVVENATCDVEDCLMRGNIAENGGAVAVGIRAAGHVRLHYCTLHSNVASASGGGIYAFTDPKTPAVQAVSCMFVNNSVGAQAEGGAMFVGGLATVTLTGHTVGNSNYAGGSGGFARVDVGARLMVTHGSFSGNYVGSGGRGGLVAVSKQAAVVLDNCLVHGSAQQLAVWGGVFNVDGESTLNMSACTFIGVQADAGGLIAASGNSSIYARNCTVDNCTATMYGGGLYVFAARHISWVGGAFRNMRAREGAAINILDGFISLVDTVFINGTAFAGGGGAMFVENTAHVVMTHCSLHNCTSTNGGGGGVLVQNTAHVVMTHCSLHDCTSTDDGGGVLVKGSAQVRLADSTISWCSSRDFGGGALAAYDNSTLHLVRCHIHHNEARTCGGAIAQSGTSAIVLTNCSISDNVCKDLGGGLCAGMDSSVQLHDCVVLRNVATQGGGVFLGENAAMRLDATIVELNKATWGGGVALDSSNFSVAQVQQSVRRNKGSNWVDDVYVTPQALVNINNSTVEGFVSRLGADAGLVNVSLLVTGHRGLPAEGIAVKAMLDGLELSNAISDVGGRVDLLIKLRKPPGAMVVVAGRIPPCTLHIDTAWPTRACAHMYIMDSMTLHCRHKCHMRGL